MLTLITSDESPFGFIEVISQDINLKLHARAPLARSAAPSNRLAPRGYRSGYSTDGKYHSYSSSRWWNLFLRKGKDAQSAEDYSGIVILSVGQQIENVPDFSETRSLFYVRVSKEGKCRIHRDVGPAVLILPGGATEKDYSLMAWYRDGQRHRVNGPAIIRKNKGAVPAEEWWVRGRHIPDAQVREIIAKHELPGNHNEWTDNDAGVFSLAA